MIKVLIVDDSLLIRKLLKEMLSRDKDIQVVDTACDPYDAREKIKIHKPDVITLDVEMPKMNGIQFLSNLMRLHPLPVIMISTLTMEGADVTLKALELGAVDYICKPGFNIKNELDKYSGDLIAKVKSAYGAKPRALNLPLKNKNNKDGTQNSHQSEIPVHQAESHIIAIGSSTGGVEAIHELLMTLPDNLPGIIITQHIPVTFSERLAARLDKMLSMSVQVAKDNMEIRPGAVFVAPGDKHLQVIKRGNKFYCQLDDGPPVSMHKPSVDVMFDSVAREAGKKAIGVVLTGMGKDGAQGLKNMLDAGANTAVQDENSSVVWGMPGSAVKLHAAQHQLPLAKIGKYLTDTVQDKCAVSKTAA